MNEEIQKKPTNKTLVVLFGILDVLLIIALALTFFLKEGAASDMKPDISKDFKINAENYGKSDSKEEYASNVTIVYNGSGIVEEESAKKSESEKGQEESSEFVFPNSDKELLTDVQIAEKVKDKSTLRYAINEIYARHGYQFSTEEYSNYFGQFDWYKNLPKEADMNVISAGFSATEKANVEKLQAYSSANGWS